MQGIKSMFGRYLVCCLFHYRKGIPIMNKMWLNTNGSRLQIYNRSHTR